MNRVADRIRVLHLIKGLGRGGAEMLLPESLRFADRDRFEYRYVYFLPWKNALVPTLEAQGADVLCVARPDSVRILASAFAVARHLRRHAIDIVHAHLPIAGVVARMAGRLAGVPVVYSEHNLHERYHPATRLLNRLSWTWQDHAVAVSAEVAESIRAGVGERVPVEIVLNGVDVYRFRRDAGKGRAIRERYGIDPDAPVVGSVAVFRTQKRLEDWVEAAAGIHQRRPDARFLLVGDGPLRQEVLEAVRSNGLEDVLHLAGLQEDVRPYLSAFDVYMMSSIFEGLPVALLEAMSAECVPVCTAVGGIPEVVRSGENGILTEPRNPGALAGAAADLLERPRERDALARAARRTVADSFSMQRMVAQLEAIYTNVWTGRGHDA